MRKFSLIISRQDGGTPGYVWPFNRSYKWWPKAPVRRFLALLWWVAAFAILGACTPMQVIEKVASTVAKPVLGLAVKDAQTTLAWVDREETAGRLAPVDVDLARKCPEAVLALNVLRERMSEGTARVETFRGLIYYGTLNRYGRGVQAEAGRYLQDVATACLPLIPAEKLMKIF